MKTSTDFSPLRPRVANERELLLCKEIESGSWPYRLHRFALFNRAMKGEMLTFRAISWCPTTRRLFVLRVDPHATPKGSSLPIPWICTDGSDLSKEIVCIEESVRPRFMQSHLQKIDVPPSCLTGLRARNLIIDSLLGLDPTGEGDSTQLLFNDLVISSQNDRNAAIDHICKSLGKDTRTYRPYLLKLMHKYFWFGAGPLALMNLAPKQGGPGKPRVGVNKRKPGPLSSFEQLARDRAQILGIDFDSKRQLPVRPGDIKKILSALIEHWAKKRESLAETFRIMVRDDYFKYSLRFIPTWNMFRDHAHDLIKKYDLKRIRNGETLTRQYNDARVGQSGDLTFGLIEILDVDGFEAKVRVAARVGAKTESIGITVIFGVSRLSGVVLGYEIAITGENAESFRRCVASAYTPKSERAFQLGLDNLTGLLHGNVDGIFVDNGAGASEQVIKIACDQMSLKRMLPPPGRGDLKGVGEGLNNIMIRLMASHEAGYTRGKDPLSKDTRRKKARNQPMPLDDFERLLLKAINQYNLYTNKKRLRTARMRNAGVGISPASIFKYTQSLRRGDAARILSAAELQNRFIPWLPKTCRKGLIFFMNDRFTSTAMEEFFNDHAKAIGKVKNPEVQIKRLSGSPFKVLWKREDGVIAELTMVEEDQRRHSVTSWKGIDLDNYADKIEEAKLKRKREKNGGKITLNQQEQVMAAERNRRHTHGQLIGHTVKAARKNAKSHREQEYGALESEALNVRGDKIDVNLVAQKTQPELDEHFEQEAYVNLGLIDES